MYLSPLRLSRLVDPDAGCAHSVKVREFSQQRALILGGQLTHPEPMHMLVHRIGSSLLLSSARPVATVARVSQ